VGNVEAKGDRQVSSATSGAESLDGRRIQEHKVLTLNAR
jgi:hypothetical protein